MALLSVVRHVVLSVDNKDIKEIVTVECVLCVMVCHDGNIPS